MDLLSYSFKANDARILPFHADSSNYLTTSNSREVHSLGTLLDSGRPCCALCRDGRDTSDRRASFAERPARPSTSERSAGEAAAGASRITQPGLGNDHDEIERRAGHGHEEDLNVDSSRLHRTTSHCCVCLLLMRPRGRPHCGARAGTQSARGAEQ